jgi:hypothetical protein
LSSDGCTGVTEAYQPCCHEHDIAYATGRTVEGAPVTRAEADAMFRRCIQARSPLGRLSPMAWWRWAGVRVFGAGRYHPQPRHEWP